MLVETTAHCGPLRPRGLTRGARDAPLRRMATSKNIHEWHDHSGARWLIPMMALLAAVILGIVAMLVYPYVSG